VSESTDKLRALLAEAGLSQRAAARELEIDDRTMRHWCADHLNKMDFKNMRDFELETVRRSVK
jgi:hypothetical protein